MRETRVGLAVTSGTIITCCSWSSAPTSSLCCSCVGCTTASSAWHVNRYRIFSLFAEKLMGYIHLLCLTQTVFFRNTLASNQSKKKKQVHPFILRSLSSSGSSYSCSHSIRHSFINMSEGGHTKGTQSHRDSCYRAWSLHCLLAAVHRLLHLHGPEA